MSVRVKGCVRRRPPPHPPSAAMREKKKNGFIITLTNGNSFSPWRCRLYWGCGEKKLQVHLTSRIPSGVVFGGLRDWMECYSPLSVMTQWLRRSGQVLTWNDKGHKLPALKINRTPTSWNSGFKQRGWYWSLPPRKASCLLHTTLEFIFLFKINNIMKMFLNPFIRKALALCWHFRPRPCCTVKLLLGNGLYS